MRRSFAAIALAVLTLGLAAPAAADHTNPTTPQSATGPPLPADEILAQGAGTWQFITNFPPNPGTDLKFFQKNGDTYVSSGTLGQGQEQHVGQRILRLVNDGVVQPTWIADHGSAHCQTQNTGVLSLQHDASVTPQSNPLLLIDNTDTSGRCHDPGGGGLEIIDISTLHTNPASVRELHLTRHVGTSHTMTTDPNRPGIIYNSSSESNTTALWIDVVDARSCFAKGSLAQKRNACRPQVYRLSWEDHPDWTQRDPDGEEGPQPNAANSASSCHDITIVGNKLYCASLNATIVFDVTNMFDPTTGRPNGTPLTCPVIPGTRTGAKVTNCAGVGVSTPENPVPHLSGWKFLGNYNHPGRPPNQQNNNLEVRSDEGVSVAHESDPTPDGRYLMVTDERGGGVVPPGASCAPGIDNPYGNGGLHVLDLTRRAPDLNGGPDYIPYARESDGSKAIWIGDAVVPSPTFCNIHVIQQVPGEARVFMAYYSQGIKVLDYAIVNGRWRFTEVASLTLPGDNDWTAEPFRIVDNADGTRTYFLMASDIQRGIDIVSWTGPKNPLPKSGIAQASSARAMSMGDLTLLALAILGLPIAALAGRRRRRTA